MKVGTDGVLLGAWANVENAKNILDIGTGSGLIALMLAQRSEAFVEALDVDKNAYRQAQINFENSPFKNRLKIENIDFQSFSSPVKYDLLVSNPPYFSNSLKPNDKGRLVARHDDRLPLADLIRKTASLLSSQGKLALIIPYESIGNVETIADESQLFLCRKTLVASSPHHPPKRTLLEFSCHLIKLQENEIFIEKFPQVYSEEYVELTKDFYLKMAPPPLELLRNEHAKLAQRGLTSKTLC
jgi:tRNA1Val (adenine37-N6)-methyltransferase